jgi:hypothetical protein
MSTQNGPAIQVTGLVASGDLSAKQYQPVKAASTAGAVVAAAAVTDKVIGILQNDPTNGQPAAIIALGNSKAKLAASIAAGSLLTPNSTGYLKAAASANDRIVGIALATASSTAGEIHPILVTPGNF